MYVYLHRNKCATNTLEQGRGREGEEEKELYDPGNNQTF